MNQPVLNVVKTKGQIINDYGDLQHQIRKANEVVNELKKQAEELKFQLMNTMEDQGETRSATDNFSVTLKEDVLPQITDFDALCAWVLKTENFGLFRKQLLATAYREELQLQEAIPGVEPVTKRNLTFKTLT
jgi:TolA-binding protein